MVNAEVTSGGELLLDGQIVGRLQGFRFTPEANPDAEPARSDNVDLASAITQEFEVRANRFSEAVDSALVLANDGAIRWLGDPVAKIAAGDKLLAPRALLLADEALAGAALEKAQARVDLWLTAYVRRLLGPLFELEAGVGLEGAARNVALQLTEALGVLERGRVAHDVKTLDQNARGLLRKLGVRFGAHYIYIPALVKPAIRVLATQLWALRQSGGAAGAGLDEIPQLAASGRTSFLADSAIPKETYRVAGFRLCGDRAVRVDIVERLADLIRPAVAYRPGPNAGPPPPGAADGDGFIVTGAMTSLTGCSGEQFASVLRSLGFASHQVKGPALTIVAPAPSAASSLSEQSEIAADAEMAPAVADSQGPEASVENEAQLAGDPDSRHAETQLDEEMAPAAIESQNASAPFEDEARPDDDRVAPRLETPADEETGSTAPESQSAADALDGLEVQPTGDLDPPPGEGAIGQSEAVLLEPETLAILDGDHADERAASVEEVLIEVWRPRPPPHRQRNPRAGSRNNVPAQPHEAGSADRRPDSQDGETDKTRRRRHRPFQAPAPQAEQAGSGLETPPPPQKPREETNRFQRGRGPRRPFDPANKPEGGAERRGGPNRGRGQDERKQDERRQENTPAPRREAPVNLNSPFAKLLALKSQLEAKGKG
jgi:ATP-dependent RNA helicase SUPV3L1/SUV3